MASSARSPFGALLTGLVLLLALIAKWPALDAGFVYDDRFVVLQDPRIRSLEDPARFFRQGYWNVDPSVLDASGPPPLYRPLTSLSFAVEHHFFGDAPRGYHVTNLVLHLLVTLLVIGTARSLGWTAGGARLAGALFACFAIHVEAVVQIVGRAELLAALFVLLALLLHRRPGRTSAVLATLCMGAAMLSKESAVVGIPLALLADLVAPLEGRERRSLLRRPRLARLAPFVAMLVVVLLLRHSAIGLSTPDSHDRINPLMALGVAARFVRGVHLLLQYAAQSLVPISLAAEYTPYGVRFVDWGSLGGYLLVPACAVLGLVLWRRQRGTGSALLAAGWSAIAFSVTCNALVPIGTMMGDRLAYLPSVGLALLLTVPRGRAAWPPSTARARAAASLAVAFLGFQTLCSIRYAAEWTDDVRVLEAAVRHVPRSERNRELLAGAYVDRAQAAAKEQRFADALADAIHAVELDDTHPLGRLVLGKLLLREGRGTEASVHLGFVVRNLPATHPLAREAAAYLARLQGGR